MTFPEPAFNATTNLPGIPFDQMRQLVLSEVGEHGIPVLENQPERLIIDLGNGIFGLLRVESDEAAVMVGADDAQSLFLTKWSAVERIRLVFPDAADAIRWSDGDAEGSFPPNFQFVQVQKVEPAGETFLRVTFRAESFGSYGDEAIHFRVVLPPFDVEPEWPTLAPNGSIKWPEGAAAPHRPVYTARRVDHEANTLEMDVFLHEGGRMTDWTLGLLSKTDPCRTVGLIGPAGGGLIEETEVVIAADETGFPPAARLLEGLPSGSKATVFLEAEDGAACAYPIPQCDGVAVHWLARSKGEALAETVVGLLDKHSDALIWFAGERGDAKCVRDAAKAKGHDPNASYWLRK